MKNASIGILVVASFFILLAFAKQHPHQQQKTRKAILITGPIDEEKTQYFSLAHFEDFFAQHQIEVQTFYKEKAKWKQIVKAARNANFLVYAGHGMIYRGELWGEKRGIGGFLLYDEHISRKTVWEELKMAPNAIVILEHACYSAGSSANDYLRTPDIKPFAAEMRVTDYAEPFFNAGISCYFASSIFGSARYFLEKMFEGKTAREAFLATAKQAGENIEVLKPCRFNEKLEIGVAGSYWGSWEINPSIQQKEYTLAYVADPAFKL